MRNTIRSLVRLFAAGLLFKIQRVAAQDPPPVNVNDLDPLKECKRMNVQLIESGNKVYMYGGQSWVKNGTQIPFQVCNHYLRIADFSKARDLSDTSILSAKDIPGSITIYQRGAFWADEQKVYIVGGDVNDEPWLSRNGDFLPSNYTTYTAGTVFSYSLDSESWDSESAVQPNSGSQVTDSFCCGAFGYNPVYKRAYYFSGTNGAGARRLYPDTTPGYVSPVGDAIFGNGNLLTFDTASFRWTNTTTDTQLTTTGTEEGRFVYLPGTESEKGGLAVVLGGQRRDTQDMESMRKVLVYDSATSTFYGQATTSDGNFPKGRMRFCAVAASAPDNSSHNIFMYAGESPDATSSAYSDIWILSIPSFRWIKLDIDSPARKSLGCTIVGGKYMVTYGGVSAGWEDEGDEEACDDQNYGLRLFDLSSLAWTSQYEGPASGGESAFQVPKAIYGVIGGNEQGSATQTAPAAGFETAALASLFPRANPTSSTSGANGPSATKSSSPSNSTPSSTSKASSNTSAIAGGVVGGIAGLAAIVGGIFLLLRRKKKTQRAEMSAAPLAYEVDSQHGRMELSGDRQQAAPKPVVYEMYSEHPNTSPYGHDPRQRPVEM